MEEKASFVVHDTYIYEVGVKDPKEGKNDYLFTRFSNGTWEIIFVGVSPTPQLPSAGAGQLPLAGPSQPQLRVPTLFLIATKIKKLEADDEANFRIVKIGFPTIKKRFHVDRINLEYNGKNYYFSGGYIDYEVGDFWAVHALGGCKKKK